MGDIDRQAADIDAFRRDAAVRIPSDVDYDQIAGLTTSTGPAEGRPAGDAGPGRPPAGKHTGGAIAVLEFIRSLEKKSGAAA